MHRPNHFAGACASFVGFCAPVFAVSEGFDLSRPAVDQAVSSSNDSWRTTLKPYFWAAGITGDVEIRNLPPQDVDVSFSDIMDDFEIGGMLGGEFRKGDNDWAIVTDLLYLSLEDDRTNVDLTFEMFMAEVDFAFRPGEIEWLEFLAGVRYWNVDVDVDPVGPTGSSKRKDWVDPVVGARGHFPFGKGWTGQLRADVGGFGVGSESTLQFLAGIQYAFNGSLSGGLGYRAIDLDYDGDRAEYDITMSGPLLGVLWSF